MKSLINENDLDADSRTVIEAERAIWDGWRNRDVNAILAHTAEDYVAIDPDGYFDLPGALEYVPKTKLAEYSFEAMRARLISPDVIALAFTVIAQLGEEQSNRNIQLSVVSMWARRDDRWLSVLRHEMPLSMNS